LLFESPAIVTKVSEFDIGDSQGVGRHETALSHKAQLLTQSLRAVIIRAQFPLNDKG
jgi:hypothetical protein